MIFAAGLAAGAITAIAVLVIWACALQRRAAAQLAALLARAADARAHGWRIRRVSRHLYRLPGQAGSHERGVVGRWAERWQCPRRATRRRERR